MCSVAYVGCSHSCERPPPSDRSLRSVDGALRLRRARKPLHSRSAPAGMMGDSKAGLSFMGSSAADDAGKKRDVDAAAFALTEPSTVAPPLSATREVELVLVMMARSVRSGSRSFVQKAVAAVMSEHPVWAAICLTVATSSPYSITSEESVRVLVGGGGAELAEDGRERAVACENARASRFAASSCAVSSTIHGGRVPCTCHAKASTHASNGS